MSGYSPVTGRLSASRRAATYVPIVHGANTDDPDVWAADVLHRVVRRWSEREEYLIEDTGCPGDCRLHPGRHRHLRITRDGSTADVDLEAVYWGSLVRAGSWWTALRQAFHVGAAVLLADFAAVWSSIFGRHAYRSTPAPGPLLALGRLLTLLVRLLAAPLVVAGLLVVAALPRFRLLVADAYAWLTDDDVREAIVGTVTDAVRRAHAQRTVLAGHSQGGSIVLQARERLLSSGTITAADRVTTFGNAAPLLRTVRRLGIQDGLGSYWAVLALLWVLAVIVAIAPALALAILMATAGKVVAVILAAGGAVWALADGVPIDPVAVIEVFPAFGDFVPPASAALALSLVPVAAAGIVVSVILRNTGLAERILAGPDAVRSADVPGHDVIARDDPLAPMVRAIGDRQRLTQIPQTASILLDHQAYFRNAATSLPTLFDDVWQRAADGRPEGEAAVEGQPAADGEADTNGEPGNDLRTLTERYRRGLRTRRLGMFLGWAAVVTGAIALGRVTGLAAPAWLMAAVLSVGAACARLIVLWAWMERMDIAARTGPHVIARVSRRRRAAKSGVFSAVLFAAAALCLGAAIGAPGHGTAEATPTEFLQAPAVHSSVLQPPALTVALFVLGAGLLAAAIASPTGSALAGITGITCLLAYSALWFAHGPIGWIAIAAAASISAAYAVFAGRSG